MIQELFTERLRMRPFKKDDAQLIFMLDSDPAVMQYLGGDVMKAPEEAKKVIDYLLEQYQQFGIARYAVELKSSGEFIGWAGLKYMDQELNGHINFYDLGYRFCSAHWGKGYATEAAKAWLDYADGEGRLSPVSAYISAGHLASQNVLIKCGFQLGEQFHDGFDLCTWLSRSPIHP